MAGRYMKIAEVQTAAKVATRAELWAAIERHEFPKPVVRGVRVLGWMRWQVEACVAGKAWA